MPYPSHAIRSTARVVIDGLGHQAARPRRCGLDARSCPLVAFEFVGEDAECTAQHPGGAVRVLAGASARQLTGPADKALEIVPVA